MKYVRKKWHTRNYYSKERKAAVTFDKRVKNDAGAGADGHGDEERRPSLCEKVAHMLVTVCYDSPAGSGEEEDDDDN